MGREDRTRGRLHAKRTRFRSSYRARLVIWNCIEWKSNTWTSLYTRVFEGGATPAYLDDGWVRVLRPFNSISVISRRWKGEHERLCAMKRRLGSRRISPPAGFEPATPWTEVGSANRSATRTLLSLFGLAPLNSCSCFYPFLNAYSTDCIYGPQRYSMHDTLVSQ